MYRLQKSAATGAWIGLKYEDRGVGFGHQLLWRDSSIPTYTQFAWSPDALDSKPCIYQKDDWTARWERETCSQDRDAICEKPKGASSSL